MRTWLALIIILAICPFSTVKGQTSTQVEFSDLAVFYRYGEQVTFQVQLSLPEAVSQLYLFFQAEGETTRTEKVTINPEGEVIYKYNLANKPLRPFARVDYWFRATTQANETFTSEKLYFFYSDNRFEWQTLEEKGLQANWIQGDVVFGQSILNSAKMGLRSAAGYLQATLPTPLRIFVYGRAGDLQSALQLGQQSWVAGHASPDLGVILLSIPQGMDQQIELDRQLPHEIMHVLAYQASKDTYEKLPVWFLEGLASLAETSPNPDYRVALDQAILNRNLIPITSLCASFPMEASGAILAYAQSASFARFLHQKFGASGLQKLVDAYKNGLGCAEGVAASFGSTIEQLEIRWRQESLGMDTTALALNTLAPYLGVGLVLILIPLGYALLIPSSKQKTAKIRKEDGNS